MKNLRMFKLITGEEIVAEVVRGDPDGYQWAVINAIVLMLGENGAIIFPWGHHLKDHEIIINEEHIIYSGIPRDELVERYEEAFKQSKIVTPKKSLLVG